jgi:low temperature requirement protein LtrA
MILSLRHHILGRFELFLDLLYVAILANFAEDLADEPTGPKVLKYILIITVAWHVWGDIRELLDSYYNDDLAQRILILWMMALLVLYGNNATMVAEDIGAMRTTVAAYMLARLSAVVAMTVYSFASYQHRIQQRLYIGVTLFGLLLFIPLYFESLTIRSKIAVAVVAIVFEEIMWVTTYSRLPNKIFKLRFSTAVDVSHEIDRFAAFYIIVLGEYLYGIVVPSPAAIGLNTRSLRAIWTLIIAFCLNWIYLHGDGALQSTHPIRRNVYTAFAWILLHLPLVSSLLAGGHVAALSASTDDIEGGRLWLMCGGLSIGLVVLFLFAFLSSSQDAPGELLLSKVRSLSNKRLMITDAKL